MNHIIGRLTLTVLAAGILLGVAFAVGMLLAASARAQQPQVQPATELDLCRQQLASTHDASDAKERKIALSFAEYERGAEAREATLIEWLKAAQAGAKQ